jgi:hypothetical protein
MKNSVRTSLVFVCLLVLSTVAAAQTVTTDPRYAEFTASADHSTVVDGQSVITGYTLRFYLVGATQPFQAAPLGKPTPDANSLIRVDMTATLTAFPPPGVVYESRVSADGPFGSSASAASNQFEFSDPCAVSVSPTSTTASAGASTGSFTVTTGTGCMWTATSNQSWLTITGGASGSGSGSVSFSIATNATSVARTATISVGSKTFTVTQSGVACIYSISPTNATIGDLSVSKSVSVTTTSGCSWTARSNVAWITISAGASGSGSGTVTYSVSANTSPSARTGTITIAGSTFTLNQTAPLSAPTNLRIVR